MESPKAPDALVLRPKIEVADIFKKYPHFMPRPLHIGAAKVVRDIIDCRTRKLGGHVRQCQDCRHEEISYNSCRNRHCPKCQFLARAEWVDARINELLPVEYFHVVFTLIALLRPLILQNKKALYGLLFRAASETLKEVGARKLQGAEVGFFAVLHTWDQKLIDHPHLHVVIPGGGLKTKPDGQDQWVPGKRGYLFPIEILSKVFRAKFLEGLKVLQSELKYEGNLKKYSDPRRFQKFLNELTRQPWVVYAKPPFAGPEQVINYLGNYTHRIAISNYRIFKIQEDHVYFRYRDSTDGKKKKVMRLHVQEFMRRFLLHVLPYRFVRLRHYGFLGNRLRKEKIARLKKILIPAELQNNLIPKEAPKDLDWQDRLKEISGVDVCACPKCKTGRMIEVRVIESFYQRRWRRGRTQKKAAWDTS